MSYTIPKGHHPWDKSNNPLLLKDDVGMGKPSSYRLPQQQFTYGRPLPRDREQADIVTSTWNFHQNTSEVPPQRDFKKLNSIAAQQGISKAHDQYNFRRENDARVRIQRGQNALPILLPEENFRYGQANKPQTPIQLVLGHGYGLEAEQRLDQAYKVQNQNTIYSSIQLMPRANKASVLSYQNNKNKIQSLNSTGQDEYFKLSKFKNVYPRIDSNIRFRANTTQNILPQTQNI